MFVRMSITAILATAYIWWARIPDAPFGPKGVRLLLVARGVGGFFGAFGIYGTFFFPDFSNMTMFLEGKMIRMNDDQVEANTSSRI